MTQPTSDQLRQSKCVPCEGGVPVIDPQAAGEYLTATPRWSLDPSGKAIERKLSGRHFAQAIEWIDRIAELAEQEQHHPDLHLTGYRNLRVVLTTHAIDGLSENDFILAAKIDSLLP